MEAAAQIPSKINTPAELTVVIPLFPRHPGLRPALDSLRTQTRRPDLVVLLDNGTDPDAGAFARLLPGIPVEITQTKASDTAEALNHAVKMLVHTEFLAVLTSHGVFLPSRLERSLAAMRDPARTRMPGLVITALELTNAHGKRLAPDDSRQAHLSRLWAPGRDGVAIPDWLGAGDFILGAPNLFARRAYLAANPLPVGTPIFHYLAAIQAGMQGLLAVLDEPLLELNWPGPDTTPSALGLSAQLRARAALLAALSEKMAFSFETRRNLAAFHRAAWENLSGLREDLFIQVALLLASYVKESEVAKALERVLNTGGSLDAPPFLRDLRSNLADPAAYAAALSSARTELDALRKDSAFAQKTISAAQSSGWIRFAAWLGDRHARRVMGMDTEEESLPPLKPSRNADSSAKELP